jgi:hypothetical protein
VTRSPNFKFSTRRVTLVIPTLIALGARAWSPRRFNLARAAAESLLPVASASISRALSVDCAIGKKPRTDDSARDCHSLQKVSVYTNEPLCNRTTPVLRFTRGFKGASFPHSPHRFPGSVCVCRVRNTRGRAHEPRFLHEARVKPLQPASCGLLFYCPNKSGFRAIYALKH